MNETIVKVGQVYRHRRTGREMRITRQHLGHGRDLADDWSWEGTEERPRRRRGRSYGEYILRNYEQVDA